MDLRLSIDPARLIKIAEFANKLTDLYHEYLDLSPDFDNTVFVVNDYDGSTIGTIEVTESATFEFFPHDGVTKA